MAAAAKMNRWRLILSGHNGPYANMAIDEAILKTYAAGSAPPTLRIYGWNPAGISLGYFQRANEVLDLAKCAGQGILFVRRITGGEAIFHANEVTYSIICSRETPGLPKPVKESFKTLCSFIINAYKRLGLEPYFFSENRNESPGAKPKHSGFCFAQSQDFDIAIRGKKIGGNAQKRNREIIFQHGSIPLTLDAGRIKTFFREELNGLEEKVISLKKAAGKKIDFNQFSSMLADSFRQTFCVELAKDNLTAPELKLAALLEKEKYGSKRWNLLRKARREI